MIVQIKIDRLRPIAFKNPRCLLKSFPRARKIQEISTSVTFVKNPKWLAVAAAPMDLRIVAVYSEREPLLKLSRQPDLGRRRRFRNPMLQGLWSFPVASPFHKFLVFYRVTNDTLEAWRLMHGARDLPRRLFEVPGD
jgi:hypothetical protein